MHQCIGQQLARVELREVLGILHSRIPNMRLAELRWSAAARLSVDPQLAAIGPAPVWLEQLPATHEAACRLITELARN